MSKTVYFDINKITLFKFPDTVYQWCIVCHNERIVEENTDGMIHTHSTSTHQDILEELMPSRSNPFQFEHSYIPEKHGSERYLN